MSAEELSAAASLIREHYAASETDSGEDDPFMYAVAEWLDLMAGREPYFAPVGYRLALAAARAYLGEDE